VQRDEAGVQTASVESHAAEHSVDGFRVKERGALAFADILLLGASIVTTVIAFWRIARLAGALLVPY